MDLHCRSIKQGSLFDEGPGTRHAPAVMIALDALNAQYGKDTVRVGSAGGVGRWAARFDHKTPCYTTNWDELPHLK